MNLKTYVIIGCLSFSFANGLFAQENTEAESKPRKSSGEENFWDKVYVGGSFWMQFGNVTFIDVSPLVGYRFTDKFSAGPGIVYQYYKDDRYSPSYETNTYGFRFFARHTIFKQLFAQAQYESLSTEFLYIDGSKSREWVQGAFIGGGIAQPLGRRGAIILSGMYNLLYDEERSPYPSAWVFNIGFTL
jgi:hypothetical protein